MDEEVGKRRQRRQHKETERRVRFFAAPLEEQDHARASKDEQAGPQQRDLRADELGYEGQRGQRPVKLGSASPELEGQRRHPVGCVPPQHRRKDGCRHRPAGMELPCPQPAAGGVMPDDPQHDAGTEERAGVFRGKSEACKYAEGEPPVGIAAAQQFGRRPDCQRPEQHRRCVRRDDQKPRRRTQCDVEPQHRERRDPLVAAQQVGRPEDRQRTDWRRQDRQQPRPKFGIADQRTARRDEPCDGRRVIVVAGLQRIVRPQRVIGFVADEPGVGADRQLHRRQADDEHRKPEQCRRAEPASLDGLVSLCLNLCHGCGGSLTINRLPSTRNPVGWTGQAALTMSRSPVQSGRRDASLSPRRRV